MAGTSQCKRYATGCKPHLPQNICRSTTMCVESQDRLLFLEDPTRSIIAKSFCLPPSSPTASTDESCNHVISQRLQKNLRNPGKTKMQCSRARLRLQKDLRSRRLVDPPSAHYYCLLVNLHVVLQLLWPPHYGNPGGYG